MLIDDIIKPKDNTEDNTIEAIADEYGLDVIETTSNGNGYPENLQKALVGFETFEEAQNVAEQYGMMITTFTKKDGQQLYFRNGNQTYEPLRITAEDYGDDYKAYSSKEAKSYFEEVKLRLCEFENISDLKDFIDEQYPIIEELEYIDDDELVIVHNNEYYDTINREMMDWCHDTKQIIIGVI
jgi:hypothetical protein